MNKILGEKIITLKKYTYKIKVFPYHDDPGTLVWSAYKLDKYNPRYEREVPCFTRAEEKAFPKRLAKEAHAFFKTFTQ